MRWQQAKRQSLTFAKAVAVQRDELMRSTEEFENKSRASDKLLGKHYRQVSIKLHPDKNDGLPRDVFDRFKVYMDVLRDSDKRVKYLTEMLEIQRRLPQHVVRSHQTWMKANSDHEEGDVAVDSSKPKVIMTGELAQKPKKPLLLQFGQKLTGHIAIIR